MRFSIVCSPLLPRCTFSRNIFWFPSKSLDNFSPHRQLWLLFLSRSLPVLTQLSVHDTYNKISHLFAAAISLQLVSFLPQLHHLHRAIHSPVPMFTNAPHAAYIFDIVLHQSPCLLNFSNSSTLWTSPPSTVHNNSLALSLSPVQVNIKKTKKLNKKATDVLQINL